MGIGVHNHHTATHLSTIVERGAQRGCVRSRARRSEQLYSLGIVRSSPHTLEQSQVQQSQHCTGSLSSNTSTHLDPINA